MPQTVAPGRPSQRPDPEALLLAAVRERQVQPCLQLIERWVHRHGVASLERFRQEVLAESLGQEAASWLEGLLQADPGSPGAGAAPEGGNASPEPLPGRGLGVTTEGAASASPPPLPSPEHGAVLSARAEAAVDAAFAALAETFPEALEGTSELVARPRGSSALPHSAAATTAAAAAAAAGITAKTAITAETAAGAPPARREGPQADQAEASITAASTAHGPEAEDSAASTSPSLAPQVVAWGAARGDSAGATAVAVNRVPSSRPPSELIPDPLSRQAAGAEVTAAPVPAAGLPSPEPAFPPGSPLPPQGLNAEPSLSPSLPLAPGAAATGASPLPDLESTASPAEVMSAGSIATPAALAGGTRALLSRVRGGLSRRSARGLSQLRGLMRDCIEETVSMLRAPADEAAADSGPAALAPSAPSPSPAWSAAASTPPPAFSGAAIPAGAPPSRTSADGITRTAAPAAPAGRAPAGRASAGDGLPTETRVFGSSADAAAAERGPLQLDTPAAAAGGAAPARSQPAEADPEPRRSPMFRLRPAGPGRRSQEPGGRPAPAPAALSDLRSWLPDPKDVPHAS